MTHRVAHRGPNGFGFAYFESGQGASHEIIHDENRSPKLKHPIVGLGNRRLAILDLSQLGNMPMQIENGAYCVTYNGEIYNYKEIRAELETHGFQFRTGTDTEVLLRSFQYWGAECLQRFNGMWSLAIWDRRRQQLFCARDRFGVKPFYYAWHENAFYFASEIKQILFGSNIPRVANPRTVYQFLEQGVADYSSHTFFENIFQLQPGHTLTLNVADSCDFVIRQYWELAIQPELTMKEEEALEGFRERFVQSVNLRLRSDVPVGASLSGGLDSSAVICEARRQSPKQEFQTFSAAFTEKTIDERKYVDAVANSIQAKANYAFPQGKRFWDDFDKLIYFHDEPIGSGSVFAQWCVMAEAKKQKVPVLLGGQGGDEVLCGYQKYHYFHLFHLLRQRRLSLVKEVVLSLQNGTRRGWDFADASRYLPARFRRALSVVQRLCPPEFKRSAEDPTVNIGSRNTLAERQKADLTFASLPILLHYEDRNSMAHSIESRLPFLDYRLVEFTVNCPSSVKFHNGWSKWILRQSMKDTLPDIIRKRKSKLGFDVPLEGWMQEGLRNGKRDVWDTRSLQMERFVNPANLAQETRKFLHSERGMLPSHFLFRPLSLEMWARVFDVC
jgi:asparagine synthase (glutamine-hydrolysing)